jgi:hypothetical protein
MNGGEREKYPKGNEFDFQVGPINGNKTEFESAKEMYLN